MDYFYSKQIFKPEKGDLLISEPYLPDPNFERTVVLLCAHGSEGSFGFVLNKPSTLNFEDVIKDANGCNEQLYVGGPVQQDTLHFIHRSDDPEIGGMILNEGLYWGGNFDQVMNLISLGLLKPDDFRFLVGYSGWDVGQLQDELDAKSWIVYKNARPDQIFDTDPSSLWRTALEELGGKFEMFSKYPTDPRMN